MVAIPPGLRKERRPHGHVQRQQSASVGIHDPQSSTATTGWVASPSPAVDRSPGQLPSSSSTSTTTPSSSHPPPSRGPRASAVPTTTTTTTTTVAEPSQTKKSTLASPPASLTTTSPAIITQAVLPASLDTIPMPTITPTLDAPLLLDPTTTTTPTPVPDFTFGRGPRPGTVIVAVLGPLLFVFLVILFFMWWARRMAWCCVPSNAATPVEEFAVVQLSGRSSAIPHLTPRPSEDEDEEERPTRQHLEHASLAKSGQGGVGLGLVEEGYDQGHLRVPLTLEQCAARVPNHPFQISRSSSRSRSRTPSPSPAIPEAIDLSIPVVPSISTSDPLPIPVPSISTSDPLPLPSLEPPSSMYSTPLSTPAHESEWPGYTTTTKRLSSHPLSVSDKASEMGMGGAEGIAEPRGRT